MDKRTATLAMIDFLDINDISFDMDQDELADFVVEVAKGNLHIEEIAEIIQNNSQEL